MSIEGSHSMIVASPTRSYVAVIVWHFTNEWGIVTGSRCIDATAFLQHRIKTWYVGNGNSEVISDAVNSE